MMYDGGINFLRHAKDGLENNDIVKFARFLSKGQAIIAELMNTLDFDKGGSIARDLDRLYDFMLFYLTEANLQKSTQKIDRVIVLLETISGAYREIIDSGKMNLDNAVHRAETRFPTREDSETEKETSETAPKISVSF